MDDRRGQGRRTATSNAGHPLSEIEGAGTRETKVRIDTPQSGARYRRVIPLDASLAPTARVEVEAVWRHLASKHGLDPQALPRQAGWYLVVGG